MSIRIGHTANGDAVRIPDAARKTHIHLVGATGSGKSKALELMIRHDIEAGNGFCLIDPNAALYQATVQWMAATGYGDMRKVHLLNPHMHDWGFAFNPLQGDADPAVVVDAALNACVQAFGGEDMDAKPRLSRILRLMLSALLYGGLTMAESVQLLEARSGRDLREHLALEARDPVVAAGLKDLTRLDEREFTLQTESTLNRFSAFIAPPLVRRIVGQTQGIDFRQVMDRSEIMLLNLNPGAGMSEQNAKLLGTLFVNALFAAARLRPDGSRPYYVYIDECYRFLTTDVERILDEGRKYGIHLILAHQRLGQLEAAGENIYSAVMTNARTKLVFGGLTPEDAAVLECYLFMGTYDLEKTKTRITTPVTVRHDLVWLDNESRSRGFSESRSQTSSSSESKSDGTAESLSETLSQSLSNLDGETDGTSASETYDPDDEDQEAISASRGRSQSRSRSRSRGTSQGTTTATSRSSSRSTATSHATTYGTTESESVSRGRGQTFKAVLEERSLQTWSLDEQRYLNAAAIRNMPQRHAILKTPTAPAVRFQTDTVTTPIATPTRIRAFNAHALTKSPYTRPLPEIDSELQLRQLCLTERIALTVEPEEPLSFRERKRKPSKLIEG
jgi:hypothetical protein